MDPLDRLTAPSPNGQPVKKRKHYPLSPQDRAMIVQAMKSIMENPDERAGDRVKAAGQLLACDAINVQRERLAKGQTEIDAKTIIRNNIINIGKKELEAQPYDELIRLHRESMELLPGGKSEGQEDVAGEASQDATQP